MIKRKNQLFKTIPSEDLIRKVFDAFGIVELKSGYQLNRNDFFTLGTIEKVNELKEELSKHYLPCKARSYLTEINEKNILTILRQILRIKGYTTFSVEKSSNCEKYIVYTIIPIELRESVINSELPKLEIPSLVEKKPPKILVTFD